MRRATSARVSPAVEVVKGEHGPPVFVRRTTGRTAVGAGAGTSDGRAGRVARLGRRIRSLARSSGSWAVSEAAGSGRGEDDGGAGSVRAWVSSQGTAGVSGGRGSLTADSGVA